VRACRCDSKEEFKLQFSENRILRKISGLEKNKRLLQAYDMKMKFIVFITNSCIINRDGTVGIATRCGLDGQRFESQARQEILAFLKEPRSILARTKPPKQLGPGRGVKLNTLSSADV
jgi:hypothetical protein